VKNRDNPEIASKLRSFSLTPRGKLRQTSPH
jgi:hypothetical protein